ncbi:bola-like protein-domain-containing protein [Xylariomycetidae sp. FL0641]|nr:bola-like protein-domain-containing protein [Xylariomycetidae sp. FL0641]
MFRRTALTATAPRTFARYLSSAMSSQTPMEDTIRSRITSNLSPTSLNIYNDSAAHAHHAAMSASTSKETHFRVEITSPAFEGLRQPARHRLVYNLLKDEMAAQGGIHALQLKTRTPEEEAVYDASFAPAEMAVAAAMLPGGLGMGGGDKAADGNGGHGGPGGHGGHGGHGGGADGVDGGFEFDIF